MFILVSIPAGFSDALRPNSLDELDIAYSVSIPAGFSDALRHEPIYRRVDSGEVSIPAGFSDALRPDNQRHYLDMTLKFQSLLGFLMRCDSSPGLMIGPYRFNPCWVF